MRVHVHVPHYINSSHGPVYHCLTHIVQSNVDGFSEAQKLRMNPFRLNKWTFLWLPAGVTHTTSSSFSKALTSLAWLPSTTGKPAQGCSLFAQGVPEVQNILGDHAPYLDASVKPDSPLLQHLGVQSSVRLSATLTALKEWSRQPRFETDLAHMIRVYEFLSWKMACGSAADAAAVCRAFSDNELIWLPVKQEPASNSMPPVSAGLQLASYAFSPTTASGPGKFYGTGGSLCYWDPTGVIERVASSPMRSLQQPDPAYSHYPSTALGKFFCEQLLRYDSKSSDYSQGSGQYPGQQGPQLVVPSCPTTADYLSLLKSLATA